MTVSTGELDVDDNANYTYILVTGEPLSWQKNATSTAMAMQSITSMYIAFIFIWKVSLNINSRRIYMRLNGMPLSNIGLQLVQFDAYQMLGQLTEAYVQRDRVR